MKIKDLHPVDRPREKLIKLGASRLTNQELIAILINTGIKGKSALEIANQILKKYSVKEFLELDYSSLIQIAGINEAKACKILAVKELVDRDKKSANKPLEVNSPEIAAGFFHEIKNLKKEHFLVLYLNIHNELIWKEIISVGILDSVPIHPREIFEPAIRYLASSVIIGHNHPSGDVNPSTADLNITKQIAAAGDIIGIEVVDHIIVSKDNFFSFKNHNLF